MKIEASEIGKNPELIAKAQKEMAQSDILVCGKCHSVFHFIDLFKEHKTNNCKRTSAFKDCKETRSNIWAYLLWKQTKEDQHDQENKSEDNPWKFYQQWMSLNEYIRKSWLVAGKTIQSFVKFGNETFRETPVKITKTLTPENAANAKPSPVTQVVKREQFNNLTKPTGSIPKVQNTQNIQIVKSADGKLIIVDTVEKVNQNQRLINRTDPVSGAIEKASVDKIVAKRLNPRINGYDYLVKWETKPQTWEPASHLDTCKDLIDNFEVLLAKQKEMRAKSQLSQQQQSQSSVAVVQTSASTPMATSTPIVSTPNRSATSSKQKQQQAKTSASTPMATSTPIVSTPNRSATSSKQKQQQSQAKASTKTLFTTSTPVTSTSNRPETSSKQKQQHKQQRKSSSSSTNQSSLKRESLLLQQLGLGSSQELLTMMERQERESISRYQQQRQREQEGARTAAARNREIQLQQRARQEEQAILAMLNREQESIIQQRRQQEERDRALLTASFINIAFDFFL